MESHGIDTKRRRAHVREVMLAMQALWSKEVAEFRGEFVRFEPCWQWPKPVQQPRPPVLLGGAPGPTLFAHIAEYARRLDPDRRRRPARGAGRAARRAMDAAGRDFADAAHRADGRDADAGEARLLPRARRARGGAARAVGAARRRCCRCSTRTRAICAAESRKGGPPMSQPNSRNASAAVIGAGDFIGAAIARRFAREGYHGLRRPPQRREARAARRDDRGEGRALRRPRARRAQGGRGHGLHRRGRRARAARGLHLQRRRQRLLPVPRHHRARLPQGVGDGVLRRLPHRPRGGARDARARARLALLHRRDGEPARRRRASRRSPAAKAGLRASRRAWRASSARRTSTSRTW